jgi:hypothetical protein
MRTVCIDFDGVIHSYTTPWKSDAIIPDPPLPGAKEFIDILRQNYVVIIFTTRARSVEGAAAVRQWLGKYGIMVDDVRNQKPPAVCYVDDRALTFSGKFDVTLMEIENFKTWQETQQSIEENAIPTELDELNQPTTVEGEGIEGSPISGRPLSQG